MTLNRLEIWGLGSYPGQWTAFDFTSRTLLLGPNGSGKSWVLEGLCLCLFGKTARFLDLNAVVHRDLRECYLNLYFRVQDHCYCSFYYRTNTGTVKRSLKIQEGEEWSDLGGNRNNAQQVQEMLQGLLHLDWNSFRQTSLFAQNDVSSFLEGTDLRRRELLTSLLNLERFEELATQVKRQKARIQTTIASLQGQKQALQGILDTEVPAQWDQETELEALKARIIETQSVYENWTQRSQAAQVLALQRRQAQENLMRVRKSYDYSERRHLAALEKREKIGVIREHFTTHLLHLYRDLGYCQGLLEEGRIDVAKTEDCLRRRRDLQFQISQVQEQDEVEWPRLQQVQEEIEETRKQLRQAQREQADLEKLLQNLPPLPHEDFIQEKEVHERELQRLRQRQEFLLQQKSVIEERQAQGKNLSEQLETLKEMEEQVNQEAYLYEILGQAWGPHGLPDLLLRQVLEPLSGFANQWLKELGLPLHLRLIIDTKGTSQKTSLRVLVHNRGQEMELGGLSGGERQRVELALRYALARLCPAVSNLLILDEVTTGVDEEGLHALADLLNRTPGQVIAVSHEEVLAPAFDQVIRLRNEKGETVVP